MKVLVDGKKEQLILIDPRSNLDYAGDYIEVGTNRDFYCDDDDDIYRCSRDTYEWWDKLLRAQQEAEYRIDELRIRCGWDEVLVALDCVDNVEIEYLPDAIHEALDEAFGEE